MKKNNIHYTRVLLLALLVLSTTLTPTEAWARKRKATRKGIQTTVEEEKKKEDNMSQSMVIEREFDPVVRDANKIVRTPAIEQPIVTRTAVKYADWNASMATDTTVTQLPVGQVFDDRAFSPYRGYLDANLGNYWNTNIDAGYKIIDDDKTQVLVNGGYHMSIADIESNHKNYFDKTRLPDWKNRYYNGYVAAALTRDLSAMTVEASVHYDYKNYTLPNALLGDENYITNFPPTNTKFIWTTTDEDENVGLSDFHFGITLDNHKQQQEGITFRSGLELEDYAISLPDATELRFKLFGDIATRIDAYDCGLSAFISGLNYSYADREEGINALPELSDGIQISVTPYIKLQQDSLRLQVGVRADYISGPDNHWGIAPKIHMTYTFRDTKQKIYADITGGLHRYTQREMMSRYPFYLPYEQYKTPWELFDMTLGFCDHNWGDLNGEIFVGAKYTMDAMIPIVQSPRYGYTLTGIENIDDLCFKAGGKVSYTYDRYFSARGSILYNLHTKEKTGSYQPALQTGIFLYSNPLKELNIELSFRGYYGRNAWVQTISGLKELSLKSVSDLGLKGTWTFSDKFLAYASFGNLLCQKYDVWAGIPAQRLNFNIGASLQF